MTAAALFALAVAALAVLLGVEAVRKRRWLEAGICGGSVPAAVFLAVAASEPAIPLWLVLFVAWLVVVLLGLACWSLIRAVEKARTGEDTR
ncbi:hypothetical protein ITP53_16750 [Nonomuraea sp. K274]|uniref:Uncharacterized protein n=1 Tax=Nonomuraea cypriaca TaxID=1187855 RepID=A0A931ADP8_9ACTN|nr:hypothetical protein [Nonomuraea cypriaca]MBF8187352.1 hypothetical protein [Nonomuraea cypriaca]